VNSAAGETGSIENDLLYCYAKSELKSTNNSNGTGFSFTLGNGIVFECNAKSFDAGNG
jgi:hypothetical protein